MALCLLPATVFHYRPASEWLAALGRGRSFFGAVLHNPGPVLSKLAKRPRAIRIPVAVGISVAQKLAQHGGVWPSLKKGVRVLRREGIRSLVARLQDRVPQADIVVKHNANPRNVLVADYRLPMEDVSAGERATMGVIRDLVRFGYRVTFLPTNLAPVEKYQQQLESMGVRVITRNDGVSSPQQFIAQHGHAFGLFYLIRVDVAEAILPIAHQVSPNARIVFHAPDLYFLREQREAELFNDPTQQRMAAETRRRELGIMRSSDLVVVVSPVEKELLQSVLPEKPVQVFQALYVPVAENPPGFAQRRDIFFLGGFAHRPNVQAVKWFAEDIWPLIHARLPNVTFHIVGAEAPAEVRALGKLPGIRYVGYVEDLAPVLNEMRLGVAPLCYGAGIKGKVAMTMGAGVPCICTDIAAEGMFLKDGIHTLIANDPRRFADAVVSAYEDAELWNRLSANGREHIRRSFSEAANRSEMLAVLDAVRVLPIDLFNEYCGRVPAAAIPSIAESSAVDVSIIIPVYNKWHLTRACLNSILETCRGVTVSYEIILADDCSTDETLTAADQYPGLVVARTPQNMGFLRNCNNAAQRARGRYLLFLNNDTLVLPGWLDSLVRTADAHPEAAIVGSKILYPDGTIQEAGGHLFNDGTAINAGRGLPRDAAMFQTRREVDYITGCSILVRHDFWRAQGGFDTRYRTAYCEDSDLAMAARAAGMVVLYEPESTLVHYEHQSYSPLSETHRPTDLQAHNIALLLEKWSDAFAGDHLPPSAGQKAIAHSERTPSPEAAERRRSGKGLNILYFSPFPSHPPSHGNRSTILQFGKYFQQQGHKVHFAMVEKGDTYTPDDLVTMSNAWDSFTCIPCPPVMYVSGENLPFDAWYPEGLGEAIRELCLVKDIDIVFCSYIFQSRLLEFVPAHILKVIDTHDKMGNRYDMFRANGQPLEFFSCTPEDEGAYLCRADLVIARRKEEADYFNEVSGRGTAIVIPHVEPPRFLSRPFDRMQNVGMVASANRINLALMQEMLAAVEAGIGTEGNPPFTMHIAGYVKDMVDDLPASQRALFQKPWVKMHGFVQDIGDFYAAMDAIVSPVTMGTGINVKTVQAMAYGMPLLTTQWGSKGIESDEPLHNHPDLASLAESLFALAADPSRLQPLAAASRSRYARFYADSVAGFEIMFNHQKLRLAQPATAARRHPGATAPVTSGELSC